jgi:hypothetical protein
MPSEVQDKKGRNAASAEGTSYDVFYNGILRRIFEHRMKTLKYCGKNCIIRSFIHFTPHQS